MFFTLIAFLAFAIKATAFDAFRHFPLHDFTPVSGDLRVPFTVVLQSQNLDQLDRIYEDVTNPKSPNYAQYWTAERLAELTHASQDDFDTVSQWLTSGGASCEPFSNALRCSAPSDAVRSLFELEELYHIESQIDGRRSLTAHGALSIPSHLTHLVSSVTGLNKLPFQRSRGDSERTVEFRRQMADEFVRLMGGSPAATPSVGATPPPIDHPELVNQTVAGSISNTCAATNRSCTTATGVTFGCCPGISQCCPTLNGLKCCIFGSVCDQGVCRKRKNYDATDVYVTPKVLREHYSIPLRSTAFLAEENRVSQGVVAFGDQYSKEAKDLFNSAFQEQDFDVTEIYTHGRNGTFADQVESDLDIQYMSSMAPGTPQWFWFNHGNDYTLEWAQSVFNHSLTHGDDSIPLVFSISYIMGEYMFAAAFPHITEYMELSNVEFQKLGLLGVTIMACSGDTGAPAWSDNFPVPATGRNFPAPCENCTTEENMCSQISVNLTGWIPSQNASSTSLCHIPTGFQSRDPSKVAPCKDTSASPACKALLGNLSKTWAHCDFSIVQDDTKFPRVFSKLCSCAELPPLSVTVGNQTCSISGYEFDLSNGSPYTPLYPATSPYVTSVGATRLTQQSDPLCGTSGLANANPGVSPPQPIVCPQTDVASSIADHSKVTSGGGFSTQFPIKSYQEAAVNAYVSSIPLPPHVNTSFRGYPDVSFSGHNYIVAMSTANLTADPELKCPCNFIAVDGTSCSSPAFAGIVSLLNQRRKAQNQPPLGPLNQLLYTMASESPDTFQDVRYGDNRCTESVCSEWGFDTSVGWDPVSGLGTPRVSNMLTYLGLDATASVTPATPTSTTIAPEAHLQNEIDDLKENPKAPMYANILLGVDTAGVAIALSLVFFLCCKRRHGYTKSAEYREPLTGDSRQRYGSVNES